MNVVISGSQYNDPDNLPKQVRRTALLAQALHGDVVFVVQYLKGLHGVFLCADNVILHEEYGNTELQAWSDMGIALAQQLVNVVLAE